MWFKEADYDTDKEIALSSFHQLMRMQTPTLILMKRKKYSDKSF